MSGEIPVRARQLGFWMTLALVVGNIIGAGVFLLPASLAPYGESAIYGWLLTIGGVLCLAWVLAQLSARIEGGPYAYVREAVGEVPAFVVMWSYWISFWAVWGAGIEANLWGAALLATAIPVWLAMRLSSSDSSPAPEAASAAPRE